MSLKRLQHHSEVSVLVRSEGLHAGVGGSHEYSGGLCAHTQRAQSPLIKEYGLNYMGSCQNYGPFWGPYYNTARELNTP